MMYLDVWKFALLTGVSVVVAWSDVVIPLNNRFGQGEVEIEVSVARTRWQVADTFAVLEQPRDDRVQEQSLILAHVTVILVGG